MLGTWKPPEEPYVVPIAANSAGYVAVAKPVPSHSSHPFGSEVVHGYIKIVPTGKSILVKDT
jgi:hypothetical protein